MKILLWTDDLMTRVRMESRWKAAGAVMMGRDSSETPDLVAMDLTAKAALEILAQFHDRYPEIPLLAFGPHVDGDAFKAARAAGASQLVARGKVVESVLGRLSGEPGHQ